MTYNFQAQQLILPILRGEKDSLYVLFGNEFR